MPSLVLWLSAALPGLLWASQSALLASSIGRLRRKLTRSNITQVSFMIVNEQDPVSRAMYWELKRKAPTEVPVYQQGANQSDVWEVLDGDKDDFLIYDRCGLLTFHIVLPFSFLYNPYVEAAIRATYLRDICNCSSVPTKPPDVQPPDEGDTPSYETDQNSHHHHFHFDSYHRQPAGLQNQSQRQDTDLTFQSHVHSHHSQQHHHHK
ncbi:hypothetical protein XENOCAPTIV_009618 [Xenoophorus captivus]|uniref:Selenoprotein P N-terminal domain-containing protein n=2 Tax=Goodeidae TaxID=28758 RepID=A0ABV0QHG9_9TELE